MENVIAYDNADGTVVVTRRSNINTKLRPSSLLATIIRSLDADHIVVNFNGERATVGD